MAFEQGVSDENRWTSLPLPLLHFLVSHMARSLCINGLNPDVSCNMGPEMLFRKLSS